MATARRSLSSYGSFADGIIIRGMPLLTLYPGNVYWVDSNGGGGSKGTFAHPVATIAEGLALVTNDNGDIVCVKPGHTETLTATMADSGTGFALIGLGFGDNRPTITMSHTSADDGWDLDGDDIVIYNIKFVDGDAGATGALPCINCSGDNFHIENCYFYLGEDMSTCVTHDTTEKFGFHFINNTIYGYKAGPDVGVRFEKTHWNAVISGNTWLFGTSAGCDTGCIVFVSGTTGGNHLIEHERVLGLADGECYLNQSVIQADSLATDIIMLSDDSTDALGVSTASGFGFINCFATEPGKGVPDATDHVGARPLATTPAHA